MSQIQGLTRPPNRRAVMVSGPSKTTRAPIIVGPSNSGKTTLVLPFDDLFGHNRVFHKPALNSSFPLVNLSKHKRFLFFDDFRPIEYAQETIDVSTFLSLFNGHPFEIRQSQAFRHGNEDFAWRKGCCLTAKDQELWEPWGNVSAEDVQHMRNRMHVFTCHAVLQDLRQTVPCPSELPFFLFRDGKGQRPNCMAASANWLSKTIVNHFLVAIFIIDIHQRFSDGYFMMDSFEIIF